MNIIKSFLLSFIGFFSFSFLAKADYYNQEPILNTQNLLLYESQLEDCLKSLDKNFYEDINLLGIENGFEIYKAYANDLLNHTLENGQEFDNCSEILKQFEEFNQIFAITNGGGGGANKQLATFNNKFVFPHHKELIKHLNEEDCFILNETKPFYNAQIYNENNYLKHEDFNQIVAITNGGGGGANKQLVSLNFSNIQDYKDSSYFNHYNQQEIARVGSCFIIH